MHWPLLRVTVAERSMEPALRPGDWLLARRTRRIRPGQIVLARHPAKPGMLIVKRAARRTEDGWWLASDNPAAGAVDSRRFGAVPVPLIEGRVLFRYWRPRSGPRRLRLLSRTGRVPPAQANLGTLGAGLAFPVAFVPLTGAKSGNIGAVHAALGAVPPGAARAGVDEHAQAAGRLADAEPVDADVAEPDGQAHHRPGGVLVRDRTALGVMHVPWLVVVPGELRVDRMLHEQRVECGGGVFAVTLGTRDEEGAELSTKSPQGVEIIAGTADVEVLPVDDQSAQPVQAGEPVTVFAPGTSRVDEPYREFSVGVEVHSRS